MQTNITMNTLTASPWLPDFVAAWYDEFEPVSIDVLNSRGKDVLGNARTADDELRQRPHRGAKALNEWIDSARGGRQRLDRIDASLSAVSRVMQEVGITRPAGGGSDWNEIRSYFATAGNLLRDEQGFLLPGCEEDFRWRLAPPQKRYDLRFVYPGFVRGIPQKLDVKVTFVPDLEIPIEALRDQLNVGVVPLVGDVHDFDWVPVNVDPPRFRVSLKHPEAIAAKAEVAIAEAGRNQCDIVVFPELCFGHKEQESFGRVIARVARRHGGYPWLVVAGSAYTPSDASGLAFYNRAIVFDGHGRELLRYNKLFPYEFSMEEEERYGLAPLLGATARIEDIITSPRWLGILQTAIGRIAVLICEDIWNLTHFLPIVQDLAVDWLLVPVLDGIQHDARWTARNAGMYAEHGTSVVIASSTSLVEAHRAYLRGLTPISALASLRYVGLLATPGSVRRIQLFDAKPQHFEPSILTLIVPPE